MHSRPDRWIGPSISRTQMATVMGVALLTSLVAALQPMLFSALAAEHRLSTVQIGLAATLELTATGIVMTAALAKLKPTHIPMVVAPAALFFALGNYISAVAGPEGILFARTLCGACSGIFLWQLVGMLARSRLPARLNGLYLAVQGVACLVVAQAFGAWAIPHYGAWGGFIFLSGGAVIAALASPLLPRAYVTLAGAGSKGAWPTPAGWCALASVLALLAAVIAAWVYLPALAAQFGYAPRAVTLGISFALGAEIPGGLLAAAVAARISSRGALTASMIGFAVLLTVALTGPRSPILFLVFMTTFGFLWMFSTPFTYSQSTEVDPSRSSLVFVGPAQLLGCGAGPVLAALGVRGTDVRGAEYIAICFFMLSLLLAAAAQTRRPPAAAPALISSMEAAQ